MKYMPGAPVTDYPWSALRFGDLERVFVSESWAGTLTESEFERVLLKLGLGGRVVGPPLFGALYAMDIRMPYRLAAAFSLLAAGAPSAGRLGD